MRLLAAISKLPLQEKSNLEARRQLEEKAFAQGLVDGLGREVKQQDVDGSAKDYPVTFAAT